MFSFFIGGLKKSHRKRKQGKIREREREAARAHVRVRLKGVARVRWGRIRRKDGDHMSGGSTLRKTNNKIKVWGPYT